MSDLTQIEDLQRERRVLLARAESAEARCGRLEAALREAHRAFDVTSEGEHGTVLMGVSWTDSLKIVAAMSQALSDAPPPQGERDILRDHDHAVMQAFARKVDADIMASIPPSAVAAATARVVSAAKAYTAERAKQESIERTADAAAEVRCAVDALLAAEAGEKAE